MTEKILEVQSLRKYYGKKDNITKAIDNMTFQVMNGEFIGIMGSSGSGKTTLLNCIATTTRPTGGKILMKGEDISGFKGKELADYRGRRTGYLFQNFELIDNLTARENMMLPMALHNMMDNQIKRSIEELEGYFELKEIMDKFPSELSGGQKQRVAAARALILNMALAS